MKRLSRRLLPWAWLRFWINGQRSKSRKQQLECIIDTCEKHINKQQFKLTDNEKMVVVSQLYDRVWKKRTVLGDVDEYERLLGFKKQS